VPGAALGTPYRWKWALGGPTSGWMYVCVCVCVCGGDFRALARAARVEPVYVNNLGYHSNWTIHAFANHMVTNTPADETEARFFPAIHKPLAAPIPVLGS
jgi:hypothetical protein